MVWRLKLLAITALSNKGGITDIAMALNARNHKGPSSGYQMMTVAAICLKGDEEQQENE